MYKWNCSSPTPHSPTSHCVHVTHTRVFITPSPICLCSTTHPCTPLNNHSPISLHSLLPPVHLNLFPPFSPWPCPRLLLHCSSAEAAECSGPAPGSQGQRWTPPAVPLWISDSQDDESLCNRRKHTHTHTHTHKEGPATSPPDATNVHVRGNTAHMNKKRVNPAM